MSDDTEQSDGPDGEGGGAAGLVAMVLPFATSIVALVVGAIFGVALGWMVKPSSQLEIEVPRELTAAELAVACAPQIETRVTELEDAQNKVEFLEKEIAARDARVEELEAEMQRRREGRGGGKLAAELAQAKADLADALELLEIAQREKEQLVIELTQTKEELAVTERKLVEQVEKTELAKEDALVNKWYRFVREAQLDICERGNRKKLGNCREAVQTALMTNVRRDKFAHCVRSGQAVPSTRELQKGEVLPDFSEMIGEEKKQTEGWYVMFCDPTLPERNDGFLNEEHLPPTASNRGG